MQLTIKRMEELAIEAKQKRLDVFITLAAPFIKNKTLMYRYNKMDQMLKYLYENFDNNLKNKVDDKIKIVSIRVWKNF